LALTIGGTIGWTLFNKLPSMVERLRLVLGSGVWVMSITCTSCAIKGIRLCFHLSIGERESERVLCGDCLRSDCYHLEEAKA
jgi:hypothetical protein